MKNKAYTNLKNAYKAVLEKCSLMNVFGSLAIAGLFTIALASNAQAATGGTLVDKPSFAYVGLYSYSDNIANFNIHNGNAIRVINLDPRESSTYGIFARSLGGNSNLTNLASIVVNSTGEAYGIDMATNSIMLESLMPLASTLSSVSIENIAKIDVTSENRYAIGINANSDTVTVLNTGKITATGSNAYGISARGKNVTVNNSAPIKVEALGTAKGMDINISEGLEGGILVPFSLLSSVAPIAANPVAPTSATIINSESIYSSSTSGDAYGIDVSRNPTNLDLTNKAPITAITTSTDLVFNTARGIQTDGEKQVVINNAPILTNSAHGSAFGVDLVNGSSVHISNNAIVTAIAPNGQAFEAFSENNFSVGIWTTVLKIWDTDNAVFGLGTAASVDLSKAEILFRPDAKNLNFGKYFDLTHMVSGGYTGTINAKAEVPFIKAVQNGNQVALFENFTDETVPMGALFGDNVNLLHGIFSKSANKQAKMRLAKELFTGQNAFDNGIMLASNEITQVPSYDGSFWQVYADVHGTKANNTKYDFESNAYGVTLGMNYNFNPMFSLGFFFDYSQVESSGDYDLDNDNSSITLGVHSDYFVTNDWYVNANLAASFGENDLEIEYTPSVKAESDYSSTALYASLSTGYIYDLGMNQVLVPEIGLSYLYANSDSYNLDFPLASLYNMGIDNDDFNALYASFMLTWQGTFANESSTFMPSAGLGIRQNLTGNDIDTNISAFGSNYQTTASEDDTSILANVGFEWKINNFTVGAYYDGAYGSEQQSHSGNVKLTFNF